MKAMMSAARPEPSHTTTGTGGSSVTYSRTDLMVLVPPSMTRATTGMLLCVSKRVIILRVSKSFDSEVPSCFKTYMVVASNSIYIFRAFFWVWSRHRSVHQFHCPPVKSTRGGCSMTRTLTCDEQIAHVWTTKNI